MHWIDSGLALIHFFANTAQNSIQPPPNLTVPNTSSVDLKLLTEQINFLKDANSQLHHTFDSYADAIRTTIIFTGSLLTLIALATGILINQNYRTTVKELKEDTKDRMQRVQAKTWTKTNVKKHISTVRNSNRIEEIRLIKLWRDRLEIDFPSFYIELVTIKVLSGSSYYDLGTRISHKYLYGGYNPCPVKTKQGKGFDSV